LVAVCLCLALAQVARAGQGCPFDNASCQEYCSQQGCNFGYCGHFAWIQCICRKCGDEWGYYDKVHYNPDKQVNQTELDSLKLNGSEPLVLENNNNNEQQQTGNRQQQKQVKQATLTTLLIPDLSDNSKLDLNDIPEESSEKFLDFLDKNHEKLVQATTAQQQPSGQSAGKQQQQQLVILDLGDDQQAQESSTGKTLVAATTSLPLDEAQEETVEIQISSSNNNTNSQTDNKDSTVQQATEASQTRQEETADDEGQAKGEQSRRVGPVTRLLRMVVAQKSSEEIERRR